MSGTVTNEAGAPLSGMLIEIDYPTSEGKLPFVLTRTDASGFYRKTFEPIGPKQNPPNASGTIIVFSTVYQTYAKVLPWDNTDVVHDVRMSLLQAVKTGESLELSIDPDNSMCADQEDIYVPTYRCQQFRVDNTSAGTLVIEARALPGSSVVPFVSSQTSGQYHHQVWAPGAVSLLQVQAGQSYWILVGVPASSAPQSYMVSTSVR